MAPLPSPKPVEKFSRRGISIFLWLDKLNDQQGLIPTRAELDAGLNLTAAIASISGFTLENQSIETPDMSDDFDSSIPGSDKAEDSSLTFYEDKATNLIEEALAKGKQGHVVILRKGDIPGNKSMDVFPVRVGSLSPAYTTDNEAARFEVKFTITRRPAQSQPVPAVGATAKKVPA
ncbi:hypothetical protein [Streptomyces sp. CC224B]|uniref:phage tail tube protein n=1 Tax=Streptomyces sp. CC224B TaxID=3044571 RepID=UPI0024A8B74E|nr:hypothetical protein [Streptomyces sp. CC224B]